MSNLINFVEETYILIDAIKKSLKPFDYVLLLIAVWMFSSFDYNDLRFTDKIYIVSFGIWLVLLVVRTYVYYQGGHRR